MRDRMGGALKWIQDTYYTTGPPNNLADMISRERRDVYQAMDWSRLWKRAAKRWRYEWYYEQLPRVVRLVDKLLATKADADRRLELLREGLEATTRADGHWSDRVRWMRWVEKVEKELADG